MKIGFVTNLYPPYVRGGAEHVVVRTVEQLTKVGDDVFVVTGRPKNSGKNVELDDFPMERIYRFYPKNLYFVLDDYKNSIPVRFLWHMIDTFFSGTGKFVTNIFKKERPDVMITHNLKGIGLGIARKIRRAGIPHVHVVHDLQLIYPSGLLIIGKEKNLWYLKGLYCLYQRICKWQFRNPDIVIFPSEYLKTEYLRRGFFRKSQIVVMPNPVPDFNIELQEKRNEGKLRLLFVGQLEEHKGLRTLIEVIKKSDLDLRLMVAGEGKLKKYIKKISAQDKRISYMGYVSMDQLVKCLGIVDATVVPSLCYENSPTVIYESFKAGVPVLASDIGGVGELVKDGENGFLFEPGNKTSLLQSIEKLNDNKDRFDRVKIKKEIEKYSLLLYVEHLKKMLKKLI